MDINLTTPALLFPTVSLLLLAFTNRFLALASLIRALHDRYQNAPDDLIIAQIGNLRYRVMLVRQMQTCGIMSLLLCVICMFVLFGGYLLLGKITFGLSLILMMLSLGLSAREIHVSVEALNLQLQDLEVHDVRKRHR